jgi:hypothetical protein
VKSTTRARYPPNTETSSPDWLFLLNHWRSKDSLLVSQSHPWQRFRLVRVADWLTLILD